MFICDISKQKSLLAEIGSIALFLETFTYVVFLSMPRYVVRSATELLPVSGEHTKKMIGK